MRLSKLCIGITVTADGWPFWHINSVACTYRLFIGLTWVFRASKD
jgi:hypothetical protein